MATRKRAEARVLEPRSYARLRGRIPVNGRVAGWKRGPSGDLTPETREDRRSTDAPTIGFTVASRERVPAPRCADPCSTLQRARCSTAPAHQCHCGANLHFRMFDKCIKPSSIVRYLDEYVIGQDDAKKILAVAVYSHYRKIEHSQKTAGRSPRATSC